MQLPPCMQTLRAQLDEWMRSNGQRLVQGLIFAALDTCPRHLLRAVAAILRALLDDKIYSSAAHAWLSHALSMPETPGLHWCSGELASSAPTPQWQHYANDSTSSMSHCVSLEL